MSNILEIRRKNRQKSSDSYDRNRISVAKNRIIKRAKNGGIIRQSTIDDEKYEWTEQEKAILCKTQKNLEDVLYIPRRSDVFLGKHTDYLADKTHECVNLLQENLEGQSHLYAKRKCLGKKVNGKDMEIAFNSLVDRDILLRNKSDVQKELGKKKYASKINVILKIYGSENVLDLYVYPERLFNKLATSHLSSSSVKDYLSLLVSIYKKSSEFPANERQINPVLRQLQMMIPLMQLKPLQTSMKKTIKLSKEDEMSRLENAKSYRWEDIKKIPELIANHRFGGNSIEGLRDQVIACFYINENVLRDNLGSIVVGTNEPKDKESTANAIRNKQNYLNVRSGILHLNDFKTSEIFRNFKMRISDDTLKLVDKYHTKMEGVMGNRPELLIMKNDGESYKDGKLSAYISGMFKKYTKVSKFTINDLRHSVATHHRNSSQRVKEYIAYLLQHSFQQHIRYERHSDSYNDFPSFTSKRITHANTREQHMDAKYLKEKVLVVMHSGRFKGMIFPGKVNLNEDPDTKDIYRYRIIFNDPKLSAFETNLPNRDVVLA